MERGELLRKLRRAGNGRGGFLPSPKPLAALVSLLLLMLLGAGQASAQGGGSNVTTTTSSTASIAYDPPTTTTQRIDTFATRIVGQVDSSIVFDQTFDEAFADADVQAAVADARAAIVAAGGSNIAGPTRTSSQETLTGSTSTSLFSLNRTETSITSSTTFGPATILIGDDTTCAAAVAALPSSTRPQCVTNGQSQPFFVAPGTTNVNVNVHSLYFVDEAIARTDTVLTAETYELTGSPNGSSSTATTSSGGAIVYNQPSTTTQRADTFETRIVGKLDGTVVFDQTVDAAFSDPAAQAAVADAEAAVAAAGGPGTTISDPARTAGDTTPAGTTSASLFTLASTDTEVTTTTTFGPAAILIGDNPDCAEAVAALPSATRPECDGTPPTPFAVEPGTLNVNTHTQSTYVVDEAVTQTQTFLTSEIYEIVGTSGPTNTISTSSTGAITYDPPSTTTQRADTFATRIVGKLGDTVVFDQTVAAPFGDPAVVAAVAQAEAAVAAAGGPGIEIADPAQTANDTTLAGTSSASLFSLDRTDTSLTTSTTFGPATILIGEDTTCAAAIAALPGSTRPECATDGQSQPFFVVAGTTNVNTNTHRQYFVAEAVSETQTFLTSQTYEVVGADEPPVVITISPEDVPDGEVGKAYAQALTASGGTAPHTFAVSGGTLPPGLSLSAEGALSGTPSAAGDFSFTVTATDAGGNSGSRTYGMSVGAPVVITVNPPELPDGEVDARYRAELSAEGGTAPHTFAVTGGALPPGLALSAAGVIAGTPDEAGEFAFVVTATDAEGRTGSRSYSVAIAEAPVVIVISPEELPDGEVAERYRATLTAEGGAEPHTFAVTGGTLPPGLSLSAAGAISGRPTEAGDSAFTVTATDADGNTGSRDFSVSIAEAVIIVVGPGSLPEGEVGEAYSQTFSASGGTAPFTFAVTDGARRAENGLASAAPAAAVAGLPPGLTLSAAGLLSGTPSEAGDFSFTVTATDANGEVGRNSYTLGVAAAPRPDPSLDPEVIGLINAQTETVRRFATTQLGNFARRLEDLRREGRAGSRNGIRLDTGDSITTCPTPEPTEHRPFWEDPCPEDERGQGDGVGSSGFEPSDWAVWSEGVIEFGDAEAENSEFDFTTSGVTVGLDYRFSETFAGGFGLGYGHDESDIGDNGTQSDGDALSAALYGSFRPVPAIFLEAVLGYAALSFDNTRFVTETETFAEGERDGDQVFGSLGGGYQFLRGPLALSPYARFDLAWARLDAYTEEGGDAFALHYDEADVGLVNSVLGIKAEYDLAMGWGLLVPNLRAEWRQDLSGSEDAEIAYADTLTETFAVESDAASESSVLFGLGLDALLDQGFSLGLAYEASLSQDSDPDQSVRVRAAKRF